MDNSLNGKFENGLYKHLIFKLIYRAVLLIIILCSLIAAFHFYPIISIVILISTLLGIILLGLWLFYLLGKRDTI